MYVFMDSTLKKFTDTNGLNDATHHNFQCKQMFQDPDKVCREKSVGARCVNGITVTFSFNEH